MKLFPSLRLLALLRRIACALESSAAAHATLARLAQEADERRLDDGFRRTAPRKMEFGVLDPREASKRWRQAEVAAGRATEEELEERYGPLR